MREILRVTAVNTAPDSENRMHDDAVAREYGFAKGGLVPGVDVFGYMVRGLLAGDPGWMSAGRGGELRFLKPYFDGEEVVVRAWSASSSKPSEIWAGDRVVLRVDASIPHSASGQKPDFAELPVTRPEATTLSLAPGTVLGSLSRVLSQPDAKARELLELANEILMRNVVFKPWIHTGNQITWHEGISTVREVEVRGRVKSEWEHKGHRLVTVDLAYRDRVSGDAVASIEHTAIWLYLRAPQG